MLQLDNMEINDLYAKFQSASNKATKDVVGHMKYSKVGGLPPCVERACNDRREARLAMLNHPEDVGAKSNYQK